MVHSQWSIVYSQNDQPSTVTNPLMSGGIPEYYTLQIPIVAKYSFIQIFTLSKIIADRHFL